MTVTVETLALVIFCAWFPGRKRAYLTKEEANDEATQQILRGSLQNNAPAGFRPKRMLPLSRSQVLKHSLDDGLTQYDFDNKHVAAPI